MEQAEAASALGAATVRLDRALAELEGRITAVLATTQAPAGGGLFDQDHARLTADLEAARLRERELLDAGAEATRVLGRAIDEIRSALGEDRVASILNEEA